MSLKISNYLQKSYSQRFNDIILGSLGFLVLFRILLIFDISKGLHKINLFTSETLVMFFLLIGIILVVFSIYKEEKSNKRNEIIFWLLILHVIFSLILIFQVLIPDNPIILTSDDIILILLQLASLLSFFVFYNSSDIENRKRNIILLFISLSFLSYFLSSLFKISQEEFSLLFLFISNIIFWTVLWTIIVFYSKTHINQNRKVLLIISVVVAIFLAIGMSISMTRKEVLTAVISSILDNFFGLFVINNTLPFLNFNAEFILILFDTITGFVFFAVLLISFVTMKSKAERLQTASYFLVGLSGLSLLPLFGIFRILGFSYLFKIHQNSE